MFPKRHLHNRKTTGSDITDHSAQQNRHKCVFRDGEHGRQGWTPMVTEQFIHWSFPLPPHPPLTPKGVRRECQGW